MHLLLSGLFFLAQNCRLELNISHFNYVQKSDPKEYHDAYKIKHIPDNYFELAKLYQHEIA